MDMSIYNKSVTRRNKNTERQKKIIQRAAQIESRLLKLFELYMTGEEVPTKTDSLGNEYVVVPIGENKQRHKGGEHTKANVLIDNRKTDDIFAELYRRLSKIGLVVCQSKNTECSIFDKREAWLLVKHVADEGEKIDRNSSDKNSKTNDNETEKDN